MRHKADLSPEVPDLPFPIDFHVSGKTGQGVAAWLDEILATKRVIGARLLEVDYQQYGSAEAALGWLNVHARIILSAPLSPALLCGPLLDAIEKDLCASNIAITHLKIFDRTPSGWLKVSISQGANAMPEGDLLADPALDHEVAVNLRAIADPDRLRIVVTEALAGLAGSVEVLHIGAFRPSQPKPEHRFAHVI